MIDTSRGINWGPAAFIILYHIGLLCALPFYFYYHTPSLSLILISIGIFYLTGVSITAGYHRYFSHKSYKAHPVIEAILVFLGSMTAQGSVLRWSFDHRLHHAHVDTDNDPYSIKKGFWYAHCLWILEKPREIESKLVCDLERKKLVMLQHRYYPFMMVFTNAIATLFVGWLLNDYLGAFVISLWVRLFFLHHFTWFINSLAHTWGDKPFCTEQTAVNNFVISLVTFGEGYHNYHHTYANDYRNGIRWYHFDPTKWLIWTLNRFGLTKDLKRMDPYTIKKKMILERKGLLTKQLKDLWYIKKEELEKNIQEVSDRILEQIADFKKLSEKYRTAKKEQQHELLIHLKQEIKQLKKSLKSDWRHWKRLSSNIMGLKPLPV
ncbi:acyl-CoA desaturase [Waddlia chondrophila]|uniref:Putative fatty-acid desaturase n=3 Tax=Waddlia chondrophila TaxID=71667 RepID=D6YRP7_WADCW|nr:fatty acid desaturase [Waddlia chondrophila]ADI38742.1 putative fatty-acid desaturase [Waddlia chondrophila WSU 86-1044]